MAASNQTMIEALSTHVVMYNRPDIHNGEAYTQKIPQEVFDDDIETYIDKNFKETKEDWETYSRITIQQGQIRLSTLEKNRIRYIVQFTRD